MNINKLTFSSIGFPEVLRNIPDPPEQLYHTGSPLSELLNKPCVTIVGSRRVSAYGRQVTTKLAGQLAEQGIVIISGLALGVDGLAHRAALEAGGLAIGVLPGPLDNIVPATHRRLAMAVLDKGGALVSEYPPGIPPQKRNFVARNRLMAGLSPVLVITEAGEKSGSLHTARFALEQGRTVLAVPGNITSWGSAGTNNLIKTGATPITTAKDIFYALGLKATHGKPAAIKGRTEHEQTVLNLLTRGLSDGDQLLDHSGLNVSQFNQALTMLEISGKVRALGGNQWGIA